MRFPYFGYPSTSINLFIKYEVNDFTKKKKKTRKKNPYCILRIESLCGCTDMLRVIKTSCCVGEGQQTRPI